MPAPELSTKIQVERALQKALLALLKSQKDLRNFSSESHSAEITELDDPELQLVQTRLPVDFLKTVLSVCGEGIFVIDSPGRILFCNGAIPQLLGYTLTEIEGKNLHEVIYFKQSNGIVAPLDLRNASPEPESRKEVCHRESMLLHRDGRLISVNYTITPITCNHGMLGQLLIFHHLPFAKEEEPVGIRSLEAVDQELQKNIERHKIVAEFSRQALTDTNISRFLQYTVELVSRTLPAPFCKILEQPSSDADTLVLLAVTGFSPVSNGQRVNLTDEPQTEYTLQRCEMVITPDLARETRFKHSNIMNKYGLRSGLSVIIPGSEKPFGILEVNTLEESSFGENDAQFLQSLANILGIVLDRKHTEQAR